MFKKQNIHRKRSLLLVGILGFPLINFSEKIHAEDIPQDYGTGGGTASASSLHSIAIGAGATVDTNYGIAIGGSNVTGNSGIAIGRTARCEAAQCTSVGFDADALGSQSSAFGRYVQATGSSSTAIGTHTEATQSYSTALGAYADAKHSSSTAVGFNATTTASNQIMLGNSSANIVAPNLGGNGAGIVSVDNDGQLSWSADNSSGDVDFTTISASGNTTVGGDLAVTGAVKSGGKNLIKRTSDGAIHIGENSLVTIEKDGKQQLYAQDENGNAIPIDITNGTKLLINGRDVEQSINNVGALSAALTGLPTVPTDTKLACGIGSGTHGGEIAFAGGCASRVNDKLAFNAAASFVPGQDYSGDFKDSYSARAGFIWKLGKTIKPSQIGMNEKKEIDLKISKIEKENQKLKEKNLKIISQNKLLLSRLNKLEDLASKFVKSKDIAKN